MNENSYRLIIQSGPGAGQEHALIAPALTVGRYPLADIVIDDPDVSYRHAVLTRGGETYRIADLGSDAGTYVNGRRVGAEPVALSPGDIILLGSRVSAAFLTDEGELIAPTVGDESSFMPAELPNNEQPVIESSAMELPATPSSDAQSVVIESEYDPPVWGEAHPTEAPAMVPLRQPIHAGPLPAMPPPRKNTSGRIILIAAGCLVLLACCCSTTLFMYFIGGDWLLYQMGFLP